MKINIGCGKQTWPDFYCVDAVRHPRATRAPDALFAFSFDKDGNLLERLPLGDSCAAEVHNYHFIEHVHEWEAPAVVAEFYRLLKNGGNLYMELPNLEHACRNLLKGKPDQWCMWPLYGDGTHKDPYMCHKYGYTPKTIKRLLGNAGFRGIKILPPQTHGRKANRDMRVEAVK